MPLTLLGARMYLCKWAERIGPEYLMASTPSDFVYEERVWGDVDEIETEGGKPDATELIDKVCGMRCTHTHAHDPS